MRKVRASQGRITDNVRRRRLPGKCNRKQPAPDFRDQGWKGEVRAHRRTGNFAQLQTLSEATPYAGGNACVPAPARRFPAGGWSGMATCRRDRWPPRALPQGSVRTEPGLQARLACKKDAIGILFVLAESLLPGRRFETRPGRQAKTLSHTAKDRRRPKPRRRFRFRKEQKNHAIFGSAFPTPRSAAAMAARPSRDSRTAMDF